MATGITFQQVRDPAAAAGRSLAWGAAHALAGHLYTSINPLTGGVFGVAFCAGQNAIHWAWDKFMPIHNPLTTTAKWAFGYFGALEIATGAANLVGLSITFKAAVILHVSTLGLLTWGVAAVLLTVAAAIIAIKMFILGQDFNTAIQESIVLTAVSPFLFFQQISGCSDETMGAAMQYISGPIFEAFETLSKAIPEFLNDPSILLKSYEVEAVGGANPGAAGNNLL